MPEACFGLHFVFNLFVRPAVHPALLMPSAWIILDSDERSAENAPTKLESPFM
jgi:hypothetical protein